MLVAPPTSALSTQGPLKRVNRDEVCLLCADGCEAAWEQTGQRRWRPDTFMSEWLPTQLF